MKTAVVVVYHNRPKNLDHWLSIISALDKKDVSFTIVHNCDTADPAIQMRVMAAGAFYLPRPNIGFDVGAFQDVCRKRLFGFAADYDFLFWFTDDCFPMRPDFVEQFRKPFESDPAVGVTCLEISTQIRRHVRTTGFMVSRDYAEKIKFPVDPITTKDHCYMFEHRGPNAFLEQTLALKKKVVQIANVRESPVWDSGGGGHGWVNRRQEFEKSWGPLLETRMGATLGVRGSKVAVICPAFERYPVIVASMLLQTYHNWELYLIHDGPVPNDFPKFDDPRVKFITENGPRKNYGHPIREQYLLKIRDGKIKADYVVVTNDDNYHAPFYLEKLVKALDENPAAPGAYCSSMVHNYQGMPGAVHTMKDGHAVDGYGVIQIRPECGFIDCAAVMIRAETAGKTGWPSFSHSSDWDYLNKAALAGGGWKQFKVVPGVLLVHN